MQKFTWSLRSQTEVSKAVVAWKLLRLPLDISFASTSATEISSIFSTQLRSLHDPAYGVSRGDARRAKKKPLYLFILRRSPQCNHYTTFLFRRRANCITRSFCVLGISYSILQRFKRVMRTGAARRKCRERVSSAPTQGHLGKREKRSIILSFVISL